MQAFAHSLSNSASNGTSGLLPAGFGEIPKEVVATPVAPPVSRELEGLGQEPTGLGQIKMLRQVPGGKAACLRWLLAYVEGGRPIVSVAGSGFSYQKVLASIRAPQLFAFTGSGGTFLFAADIVNGKRCLKVCVDGLNVSHTPGSSTKWTVSHRHAGLGAAPTGVGQTFPPANTSTTSYDYVPWFQSPAGVDPTGSSPSAFLQVYPGDPAGVTSGTNLGNPAGGYVAALVRKLTTQWPSSKMPASGRVYFTFRDTRGGAPQTAGLPAGLALYRFRYDPAKGTPILAILAPQGFSMPGGVAIGPVAPGPIATGSTGVVWNQFAWMVLNSGQNTPPGGLPPGVTTSGSWVWDPQQGGRWVWYPADGTFALINGYWVYGDSRAFQAPGNEWAAIPMPTTSPDGTAGTWAQAHRGYFVWTPGAAVTSYSWVWWLFGFVVVGGVVYELVD